MANSSFEEIIRRAIEEGIFDDLPGKGKPLNIEQYPHQDPAWRAAHHILKNAGYSLPWIESLRDIEAELQKTRQKLLRSWTWYNEQQEKTAFHEEEWMKARQLFQVEIAEINPKIRAYNLEVPRPQFQLQLIVPEREIEKVIKSSDS